MKKKPPFRMEIAFVIVLFIGISVLPTISGNINESRNVEIVSDIEHPPLQLTVTITHPENAVYWKNQKILPFFMPLILRGDIYISAEIETPHGIDCVELWVNGVLQVVDPTPPFGEFIYGGKAFSRAKIAVVAYVTDYTQYTQGSDEIAIWRIFA